MRVKIKRMKVSLACRIFGCYIYQPDESFAFECWRCGAIPDQTEHEAVVMLDHVVDGERTIPVEYAEIELVES